jgi:hypothetical protein
LAEPESRALGTADLRARSAASTYVSMLRAGFRAACLGAGCLEHDLVVAGRGVRLRFAGPALVEPMLGALAHLESRAPAPAAATVLLWDAASTGVSLPPVQWRAGELDEHGQSRGAHVRGWDDERVYTLHDQGYGAINVFDLDSRTAIYATADADVPPHERAAPLRTLLHWALSEEGRHLVHAGGVGGPGGGVLLAGRSGSGKSTLALACVDAGLGYLGDDYVLIDVQGPETVAHSIHGTAKLDPDGASWRPELEHAVLGRDPTDNGKLVLDVARYRPESLLASMPLRAVVLPRVDAGGPTRVRRASAGEGVRAVGPSTVLQHFGHGPAGISTVAELMRRVPVYAIELGEELGPAVDAVAGLARGQAP